MTTSIELVPQLITSSGTPISSFVPKIEAQNIYFRFSEEASFALKNLNFKIAPGTLTAIVGPSGAGKSTLFDIILGIRKPNEGMILLSGLEPNLAIKKWRNCVSFVPQDLYVFPGSIRENILLELGVNNNDQDLEKAIRQSGLEEMLDWPLGLDTQIGQSGVQLSGGQRQRLAIARALVSDPKLILMDEPTSSLDAITEQRVFADLEALRRDRTLVVIAHRLSTVRNADSIIYLDGGEIRSIGTFDETRKNIPEFEKQAQLLGIS
jgi:ABC-type bacteriocin/lantibiotic exporter with double-glycine peptidase domain